MEPLSSPAGTVVFISFSCFGGGLGLTDTTLSCGVHVWGHEGGVHGSRSLAVTTTDGHHSLALNFNGDWSGDAAAVTEAEFCAK